MHPTRTALVLAMIAGALVVTGSGRDAAAQTPGEIFENAPAGEQAVHSAFLDGAAAKSVAAEALQANGGVTHDGAFSYHIPIRVPQGIDGMQPALSLDYNSRVKNGIAGVGFSLTGLPEIHRINAGRGINYDSDDDYVVNFAGWGTPDDPGKQLVYIGTKPMPDPRRDGDFPPDWVLKLAEYLFDRVWSLEATTCPATGDCRWSAVFRKQLGLNQPPLRFRNQRVPSEDVAAFVADNNTTVVPVPAPDIDYTSNSWMQF
jgi:hypothetical protein